MKKLTVVIGLALLTTFGIAQAQLFDNPYPLATNVSIAAGITWTNTASANIITLGNSMNFAVGVSTTNTAVSAAENITLSFKRSADGSVFETTPSLSVIYASSGTTRADIVQEKTNVMCKAIMLYTIANGCATGNVVTIKPVQLFRK